MLGTIGLILFSCTCSFGQLLWPGDINNNGVVNHIDLLYYGVAKDAEGPERNQEDTDWYGHTPPSPWIGIFSNGLNYCQADANGKGDVDKKDREAIWEDNYGMVHGAVSPDLFLPANPNSDPVLLLVPQENTVEPHKKLKIDVFLGDAAHPVFDYFGIAFTLFYDPDFVDDDKENSLHKPNKVKFKLEGNTWLNSGGNNKSEVFVRVNNEAGFADIVIMRKHLGGASGYGEIGTLEIVMEDIFLLQDTPTNFTVGNIKLVDDDLTEYPVAGSTAQVIVEGNHGNHALVMAPNENGEDIAEETLRHTPNEVGEEQVLNDNLYYQKPEINDASSNILIYPNPVENKVWIENLDRNKPIEKVEVFNRLGQLIYTIRNLESIKQSLDMSPYPSGVYILKVYQKQHISGYLISK